MTLLHQAAQKAVEAALRRAFSLGQTYWQQADSESSSQHRKADITADKFESLVDETLSALQQQEVPREPVATLDIVPMAEPRITLIPARSRLSLGSYLLYAAAPSTTQQQEAGNGWKLVPETITEEMHVAAIRTAMRCSGNDDFPRRVWRAMLAAAPSTPESAEKDDAGGGKEVPRG